MDLGDVLGVFGLLLYWRAVLCLLVSGAGAFLLVHFLPWFTGVQGLVFAALGLLPGFIWEEAARSSPAAPTARSTSTFVAVLAAVTFGGLWGAVSSTSVQSAAAGVVVLAVFAWAWFRYAVASKSWLSPEQGVICTVGAVVAYPIAAVIAHNAV